MRFLSSTARFFRECLNFRWILNKMVSKTCIFVCSFFYWVSIIFNMKLSLFLAHQRQGFKWTFLIKTSLLSAVVVVINFSYFYLLLQNHWANFIQTWHKTFTDEGDSSFLNEGPDPFPRGDNNEIAKVH